MDGLAEAFRHLGIEIQYDLRSARPQLRFADGDWMAVNDRVIGWIQEQIAATCQTAKSEALVFGRDTWNRAMNALLLTHETDPFHEFLLSLPPWDLSPRLPAWLREVFVIDPECDLTEWAGKFVFMGAVKRTLEPGHKLDETPVLIGGQGIGKSTATSHAFPADRRGSWFADGLNLAGQPKERVEALLGHVIVEVGEMTGSTKAEHESLKAFLSRTDDGSHRLAYRRNPESLPRRCIFVGTSNDPNCLPNDPSGNRRFVAINVEAGPHGAAGVRSYMDRHREQLWAEALHRIEAGESVHLPPVLVAAQHERNEQHRRRDDVIEDAVARWIGAGTPQNFTLGQAAVACGLAVNEADATRLDQRMLKRLSICLQRVGYVKERVQIDGRRRVLWSLPPSKT